MTSRIALLASAIGSLCLAAPAGAQQHTLAEDAKAFGARLSVINPDLSRDGNSVVYVTPAAGRSSAAVIGDLNSGQFHTLVRSDGNPETLDWCSFASASRAICRFGGLVPWQGSFENGAPVPFSRLVALNLDGTHPNLMGQSESRNDEWIRFEDAEVIDWLVDADGQV